MRVYVDASPSELACVPDKPFDWSDHKRKCFRPIAYCEILAGSYTNNEAEYLAVIRALEKFLPEVTEILSDSQLVVNQLNLKWAIKEARLKNYANQVNKLAQGTIKFIWVPREQNLAGRLLG